MPKRQNPATHEPVSPPPNKRTKGKIASTVTGKAVKSFFTPTSQKEPERVKWRVVNQSLLIGKYDVSNNEDAASKEPPTKRRKIAAFDFDSTLITTSSGNVFGKSPSDWKWWNLQIPGKLKALYADGYQLAIISNQGGLNLAGKEQTAAKTKRINDFKTKVSAVLSHIDLPLSIYAASANDMYRKPRPGMWRELLDDYDLDETGEGSVDLVNSFFVGDAAGRLARGKTKADHSSSDRDFAGNVGIEFFTPEEYFLHEEPVPWQRLLNPLDYVGEMVQAEAAVPEGSNGDDKKAPLAFEKKHDLEIVLFVGSPGSGKSTFYWTHMEPLGYARANQDTLKTRDKCIRFARQAVTEDKVSVAVDNTNADEKTRKEWIDLAKELNTPIRCIWLQAPPEVCKHNAVVRGLNDGDVWNPEKRQILPGMAFEGFKGRFQEPRVQEGFEELIKVPFKFSGSEEMKAVWTRHWT